MNIFFTTPYAGKQKYQDWIDRIIKTLREEHQVITPEDTTSYLASIKNYEKQGLNKSHAHYAFIRQGIASADAVVIEASEEDIRVGHELTLALLFHKPTLLLSQHKDFSAFITHDLLQGTTYKTKGELDQAIRTFLTNSQISRLGASMQTLSSSADNLHAVALARLRQLAKQETDQFGDWARRSEDSPQEVSKEIYTKLGRLKKQPAWSVFAPIYNEDSPDYIQSGVAQFCNEVLSRHDVTHDSLIVEAACGTAALSRQVTAYGYRRILAFDNSRPMLSEAFRLSANYPGIKILEADIHRLALPEPAKAIIWTDYSSNFALTADTLKRMLARLVDNLVPGGILLFDVRTYQGWQIDFYANPVTTFATERFQRIWLNRQNRKAMLIDFDVFIRTRDVDGAWSQWRRESLTEKMWELKNVYEIANGIKGATVLGVFGDDFRKIEPDGEQPNLAYFLLQRQ